MFRWLRRKPEAPAIPPPSPQWHVRQTEREDNGLEVHELDEVDIKELQTRTGLQRVWDRATGKFKG